MVKGLISGHVIQSVSGYKDLVLYGSVVHCVLCQNHNLMIFQVIGELYLNVLQKYSVPELV